MAMTRAARAGLWRSVATGDRTDARKATEELFEDAYGVGTTRRVPLRVYARLGGGASLRGWNEIFAVSAPANLLAGQSTDESTDGAETTRRATLGDARTTLGEGALRDASSDGTRRRGFPADQPGDALRRHVPGWVSTTCASSEREDEEIPGTERGWSGEVGA